MPIFAGALRRFTGLGLINLSIFSCMIQGLRISNAILTTPVPIRLNGIISRSHRSFVQSPLGTLNFPVIRTSSSNAAMSSSSISNDDEMVYDCEGVPVLASDMIRIAKQAGDKIMEIYSQDGDGLLVQTKDDASPLTRADIASNSIICEELKRLYPHIPLVSEENKQVPWEERKKYTHFFCVDPLDGTKEFIKRNGQFTVNIGLCCGSEPVLGIVGIPAIDKPQICYGVKGKGAFVQFDETRERRAIKCASFSESDPGLSFVASSSHNSPETVAYLSKWKDPKMKTMGSSLKLLLVAQGEAHVYPRMAPTNEWDTCAADAIVRAAGGEVVQHEGGATCEHGAPLQYNKVKPLNPWFVCRGCMI